MPTLSTLTRVCLFRAAVDEIDRKLIQLEMAKISLENEEGAESRLRLKDVEKEMSDLQVKQKELTAVWDMERKGVTYIQELKEKIDQVRRPRAWSGCVSGERGCADASRSPVWCDVTCRSRCRSIPPRGNTTWARPRSSNTVRHLLWSYHIKHAVPLQWLRRVFRHEPVHSKVVPCH